MANEALVGTALVGAGATAILDLWLLMLNRLGVTTLDMALVGRWAAHLLRGQFRHAAIRQAAAMPGERLWGWMLHYLVGIAFAVLLVSLAGLSWLRSPSITPAVAVGVCTVAVPLFVMQPAMGAGFAASKTPHPMQNCLRSIVNHTVFGLGLYLSAVSLHAVAL